MTPVLPRKRIGGQLHSFCTSCRQYKAPNEFGDWPGGKYIECLVCEELSARNLYFEIRREINIRRTKVKRVVAQLCLAWAKYTGVYDSFVKEAEDELRNSCRKEGSREALRTRKRNVFLRDKLRENSRHSELGLRKGSTSATTDSKKTHNRTNQRKKKKGKSSNVSGQGAVLGATDRSRGQNSKSISSGNGRQGTGRSNCRRSVQRCCRGISTEISKELIL